MTFQADKQSLATYAGSLGNADLSDILLWSILGALGGVPSSSSSGGYLVGTANNAGTGYSIGDTVLILFGSDGVPTGGYNLSTSAVLASAPTADDFGYSASAESPVVLLNSFQMRISGAVGTLATAFSQLAVGATGNIELDAIADDQFRTDFSYAAGNDGSTDIFDQQHYLTLYNPNGHLFGEYRVTAIVTPGDALTNTVLTVERLDASDHALQVTEAANGATFNVGSSVSINGGIPATLISNAISAGAESFEVVSGPISNDLDEGTQLGNPVADSSAISYRGWTYSNGPAPLASGLVGVNMPLGPGNIYQGNISEAAGFRAHGHTSDPILKPALATVNFYSGRLF